MQSYEYALGTPEETADIVDWTDIGTDTTVTITGLSLQEGLTYFGSVRAYNTDGNVSPTYTGDGLTIDTELPQITYVGEGLELSDIDWFNTSESVSHIWQGSDNVFIASYDFSVGTAPGQDDIVSWINMDMDTTAQSENSYFSEGTLY